MDTDYVIKTGSFTIKRFGNMYSCFDKSGNRIFVASKGFISANPEFKVTNEKGTLIGYIIQNIKGLMINYRSYEFYDENKTLLGSAAQDPQQSISSYEFWTLPLKDADEKILATAKRSAQVKGGPFLDYAVINSDGKTLAKVASVSGGFILDSLSVEVLDRNFHSLLSLELCITIAILFFDRRP